MSTNTTNRRRFLVRATVAIAALPLLRQLAGQRALAAAPPLPETNAQAKALNYVEDAATTKQSAFKPGSNCANCSFFNAETSACTIFAGFSVAPKGWCSAWALKK